jgi:hypothetical protein
VLNRTRLHYRLFAEGLFAEHSRLLPTVFEQMFHRLAQSGAVATLDWTAENSSVRSWTTLADPLSTGSTRLRHRDSSALSPTIQLHENAGIPGADVPWLLLTLGYQYHKIER